MNNQSKKKRHLFSMIPALAIICLASCTAEKNRVSENPDRIQVIRDQQTITIQAEGKNILSYQCAVQDVPAGVDPLFRRSGYIHPLWSPAGHVLTNIQPKDHYHHYGIWGPWTLTHIDGREVDFWNLSKGKGTVRFAGVESIIQNSQEGGFRIRQEHIDFTADNVGRVSIAEILDVRARPDTVEGMPVWVIDYVSRQQNVLDTPITLDAYRYGGGLGFRATAQWTKENCTVLTSEGKTRINADGTRARWCDVNGGFDNSTRSGILFLSHPSNRQHPEPMRVWPPDANSGRGDMFFELCPIRMESWTFEPHKEYILRYRMIVYDGTINSETVENLWKNYLTSVPKELAR